ncbi:MAG: hypothetical protein WAM60_07985 [Candidatus Promineifilaceae bacterium]
MPPLRSVADVEVAVCQQGSVCEQPAISPALTAAQQRLEKLRCAYRPNQIERPTPIGAEAKIERSGKVEVGRFESPQSVPTHGRIKPTTLPGHLGWNSAPAAQAYRLAFKNQQKKQEEAARLHKSADFSPLPPPQRHAPTQNCGTAADSTNGSATNTAVSEQSIKLLPDIALAILRNKLASPGRIWFLLRHIDKNGKGWISAETARSTLTQKSSPLAVCGERQLRNLLTAGDDTFWERDGERIWLKSMAKVAAILGLTRLNGRPVKLPLGVLLESIGTVRAHLYATFHSSRSHRGKATDEQQGKPISRRTLKTLCSATRRTQRLYEKRVGVSHQANYAIGQPHSTEEEHEQAWQHGHAVFRFHDRKGLVGRSGERYIAWQLPNSYTGPHAIQSKGYQRRLNRQLADLLNEGITGNGEKPTIKKLESAFRTAVFYRNGSKAAQVYNRTPDQALYWQSRLGHSQRFRIWHTLPALNRRKMAV